jgi:uncharacterized membrane protein YfcA
MSPWIIAYSLICVFGAAIVRGYSGFGFSLLVITALSLALPPAEIVPSIFMLEVAASLHLLPGIWREIHWRSIGLLLAGCVVATPFGVWLLASVPVAPMKIALAIFVLISAILLYRGYALQRMPGRAATVATGTLCGLLNGAFGIAGPPVILFYFSSPAGVAAGRASIIAFFIGTDLLGLTFQAHQGLITTTSFWRFLVFLPPLLIGVWLGARSFKQADPKRFRQWTLMLLMVLAALTGVQGIATL